MEWQPIETAPKDGTHILGCEKDGFVFVMAWDDGGILRPEWRDTIEQIHKYQPTHWMPLPAPPTDD